MTTGKTALILGASGGVGRETAKALLRRGWRIRALHRDPGRVAACLPEAAWVRGDALSAEAVAGAAAGADLVFHGVNPPGYRNWKGLALPMLENAVAAARAAGARLLFPGTLYNYGPDALPLVDEAAPQHPTTRKGTIRVAMEQRLKRAAEAGLAVQILRAGDFFGPHCGNSWFSQALVKPGRPLEAVTYPGRPEVGHAWAYLPDVGETFARLAERPAAPGDLQSFHFGGHWVEPGIAFAEGVRLAAGRPDLPLRRLPWGALRLLSPVVPSFRELLEVRYLWREPLRLDNRKLLALLGEEPHTPLALALERSLRGLGCLPE